MEVYSSDGAWTEWVCPNDETMYEGDTPINESGRRMHKAMVESCI